MFIEMYEKGELGYLEVVATNNKIVQSLVLVPKTLLESYYKGEVSLEKEWDDIYLRDHEIDNINYRTIGAKGIILNKIEGVNFYQGEYLFIK